ncbi:FmdB family zinc ribbon protein [Tomitella fengzijianii]|uniref:FmdB family transcriptional regulator n=1 Tax=Tomitella fengzijianii TaxID=2597660 RepID=A0A516X1S3_9ACTN|nr:FmdB family zinc ribbon protein [Tomitella fengzijianii]QDQ97035.1 FmdB family transcriptional regulator [Tomitella fengzijianii]
MPTYSYACTECGNSFDIVQKFSDDALTVCSDCGGRLRKLFNSVGIVFKGSGFYRTDSRSGAVPAGSSAESSSSGSSSSDSSGSAKSGDGAKSGSDAKSSPAPAASGSAAS